MKLSDISVPQVYKEESADFRFFMRWFEDALSKVQYDTENIPDLYDPIRCPEWLLWMLADTMGFKYDDRLTPAYNRLVLVYFMSMIRNKGSKDGVTLAAEVNLAQFNILNYGKEKEILNNRLEDTSVPVNSVFVTPHTDQGFIEVVYFSDKVPINACIEYVRPLGMYCFESAGVRMDARTKISIDARLTESPKNLGMSIGPTHIGHYSREDYSRLQKVRDEEVQGEAQMESYVNYIHERGKVQYAPLTEDNRYDPIDQSSGKTKREVYQANVINKRRKSKEELTESDVTGSNAFTDTPFIHDREPVYYRNSDSEGEPTENEFDYINPGYRALYSLQLSNNEHIVKSLVPVDPDYDPDDPNVKMKDQERIFGLGYTPTDVSVFRGSGELPDEAGSDDVPLVFRKNASGNYYLASGKFDKVYNLRYDKDRDLTTAVSSEGLDITTVVENRTTKVTKPRPAVNPIMTAIGDAVSLNDENSKYALRTDPDGTYPPTSELSEDEDAVIRAYDIQSDGEIVR